MLCRYSNTTEQVHGNDYQCHWSEDKSADYEETFEMMSLQVKGDSVAHWFDFGAGDNTYRKKAKDYFMSEPTELYAHKDVFDDHTDFLRVTVAPDNRASDDEIEVDRCIICHGREVVRKWGHPQVLGRRIAVPARVGLCTACQHEFEQFDADRLVQERMYPSNPFTYEDQIALVRDLRASYLGAKEQER